MTDISWSASSQTIPVGAIKAGVDKDLSDLFVGRAFHDGELIPGKIIPSRGVAYVSYNGTDHSKSTWEVLCRGSRSVSWHEASGGSVPSNAVIGGWSLKNEALYVGRVFHDGTVTPGKIHPSWGVCFIAYDGKEIGYKNYEALVLD